MLDFTILQDRLSRLDAACLCDAAKQANLTGRGFYQLDSSLRPLHPGLKLIGRAFTLTCHEDFLTVLYGLQQAEPGDVLVIDTQNSQTAVLGELFTTEAVRKKLAGIVIDGACRDSAAIKTLPIPVYSRFTNPMAGTVNRLYDIQQPILCGGAPVHPGDILFGDEDGLVVATSEIFAQLLPRAETIQATELRMLARLEQGSSLLEMVNAAEHIANIRAGRESALQFLV